LKQAKWLLEQNGQLIAEARKEAETMIREAESA
jgi:F0F1-type ATP synthase membrane subunit b/b'